MIKVYNINKISLSDEKLKEIFDKFPENLKTHINNKGVDRNRQIAIFEYFMLQKLLKRESLEGILFSENGKPYIEGEKYFNISNSKDMICLSISKKQVGVDIQKIFDYDEKLANRICSESELYKLNRARNKGKALTKLWTIKESIIKCEGQSIAQDLKNLEMDKRKYKFRSKRAGEYFITECVKFKV